MLDLEGKPFSAGKELLEIQIKIRTTHHLHIHDTLHNVTL